MFAAESGAGAGRCILRGCAGLLILLSAGCVTTRQGLPPEQQGWEQRLAGLRAIGHFQLAGRVAATDGRQGFSAGLRWHQQEDSAGLDLSAPMGFGAAHIELAPGSLAVTTSQGVTLTQSAASEQLAATLGFEPPFRSLRYWVLGASDPALPAQESLDAQQRLSHLEQDGWRIDCSDYALEGGRWLPRRISVSRQSLHLTLVVHEWRL